MTTSPPWDRDDWDPWLAVDNLPSDARILARRAAAAVTRELIEELMTTSASPDALEETTARIAQAVAVLRAHPHERGYELAESSLASMSQLRADRGDLIDYSPVMGLANPLSPPITMRREGDVTIAEVTFAAQYEGPPGCVFGGTIACAFDEVVGMASAFVQGTALTANLTVNFRRPTPLNTPVRFEGRCTKREGRKIFVHATLHHEDTLCAEADALFVKIELSRIQAMLERRDG
jgi:acyl-coenzyme A thioesterase PaaI-like protein